MPARNFQSATGYRFGFNGKESDFEIHNSSGSSYDFGARVYDPRLGRFLSIDPLAEKHSGESPYSFAGNSPILFLDEEGKTKITYITTIDKSGKSITVKKVDDKYIQKIYFPAQGSHDQTTIDYDVVINITKDYRRTNDGKPKTTVGTKLYERTIADNTKEERKAASEIIDKVTPVLDEHSEGWKNTGMVVTGASALTVQPEGVAAGTAMTEVGSVIGDVSSTLKIFGALLNGEYTKAAVLGFIMTSGKMANIGIKKSNGTTFEKYTQGQGVDAISDKASKKAEEINH